MAIKQAMGCSLLFFTLAFAGTAAADPLVSGGVLTGTISPAEEVDEHTLDADVNDSIILQIGDIGDTGLFPRIRLLDSNGSQVAWDYGEDAARIQLRVAVAGTYTVEVSDGTTAGNQTGSYILHYVKTPGPVSTPSGDQGGELTSGGEHTGDITLGDLDTYQFSLDKDDSVVMQIGDTADTNFFPWIRLFDPNGFQVTWDYGEDAARVQHRAAVAGTYTLVVADGTTAGSQTGNYVLHYVKTPGPVSTPSGDQGGELTSGIAHTGDVTLGDLDTYQFSLDKDDSVVMQIGDTAATNFFPWIRLFDPNGFQVTWDYGEDAARLQHRAAVEGTYTLIVADGTTAGNQTGNYSLHYVKTPGPVTTPSGDQGGELTSGSAHLGDVTLGDLDTYQFSLDKEDSVVMQIGDTADTNFFPWIRLFDPNGFQVTWDYGEDAARLQHRAAVAGTYTLVVADGTTAGNQTGSYVLHFVKSPGDQVISLGDDGAIVTDGDIVNAEITIGDLDVWVFGVGAGGQVTIGADDFASTSLFPWIRVFDPNGFQVSWDYDAAMASVSFVATVAGDYYAVVADGTTAGSQTGEYELSFASTIDIPVSTTVSRSGVDTDTDGDEIPDATDNCIYTENQAQTDSGGIDTTTPDGIGDACQCGDMNGDGRVTNSDSVLIRRQLLDLSSPFSANLCDVNGDGNCTNSDSVVIRRALLGLPPGVGQTCAATRLANGIEPQ